MNINFTKLTEQVKPRGVIHVGANTCQELPLYLAHGIENRIWIEPNEQLEFPKGEYIRHVAIGERCGRTKLNLASNNSESSSILEPILHKDKYKNIEFKGVIDNVIVYTLEHLLSEQTINMVLNRLNYLVLDIQGAELKALNGLGFYQSHFEVIITEAYTQELYENCGKLYEIEAFLSNYKLVEFAPEIGKGWGDAAFIRKDLI